MIELYIVRHGETNTNASGLMNGANIDLPLNKKGESQVNGLLKKMDVKFDEIYSSPLKRAVETAELLNKSNLPIKTDERLIEINHGSWDGKSLKKIIEAYPKVFDENNYETSDYIKYADNAESFGHVFNRIKSFINDISKNKNKKILIVTHGFICRSFYKIATNLPNISNIKQPDNSSVSLYMTKGNGKLYVAYYNRQDNLSYPVLGNHYE